MAGIRFILIALLAQGLVMPTASRSAASPESKTVAGFFTDLAPETANEALTKIPDLGRKLLALRSYIRAGAKLEDRWSWTKEEIAAFQGSAKQTALLAEVAAVNEHFKVANPGYSLYANTKVRSLDIQIERWNENASVGDAANEILSAWRAAFGEGAKSLADLDTKKARRWLSGFQNAKRARLAAPGLTRHGQASAIDFQVMQSETIVAGANSRQIKTKWLKDGWDEKLKKSIEAAGPSFRGPLQKPFEPWHYEYEPNIPTLQFEIHPEN